MPWLFRTVVLCPTHQKGTYLTFVARFWHLHRWRGEGSAGGLGNLREWIISTGVQRGHAQVPRDDDRREPEGILKYKNDTSVYYVRVLSPSGGKKKDQDVTEWA